MTSAAPTTATIETRGFARNPSLRTVMFETSEVYGRCVRATHAETVDQRHERGVIGR